MYYIKSTNGWYLDPQLQTIARVSLEFSWYDFITKSKAYVLSRSYHIYKSFVQIMNMDYSIILGVDIELESNKIKEEIGKHDWHDDE